MAQRDIADAEKQVGTRDKDVPWYSATLDAEVGPAARKLLEEYSNMPPAEVEAHIYKIRDQAWEVWPYPCIGQFRFLDLSISQSPHYTSILSRLQTGTQKFLDLGCCFGQDLRRLASDGAPSEKLYGCDLRLDFCQLGYELFKDRQTLKSRFLEADVFDEASALGELDGEIDIIYAGSFLHLFDLADQKRVCTRIVKLLKPVKGSVVLGRQVGHLEAGAKAHRTNLGSKMYRHNVESFEAMWREVGELTGSKWTVEAELGAWNESGRPVNSDWQDDGIRRIKFAVFRE